MLFSGISSRKAAVETKNLKNSSIDKLDKDMARNKHYI